MKTTVYLSRKLLNQLKVKETESKDLMLTHGTHTKKNGSVNVEFKTPSKSGKKSTSLKKLKIIKTISPMRSAWDKVS